MSKGNKFKFNCYLHNLENITDVVKQMKLLDSELIGSDLENLRPFNTTYLIITEAVAAKSNTGYFNNEEQMELFDVVFAKYFFNALKGYCSGLSIDRAWKILFDKCKEGRLLQFQYMALGVNAHVNNDLALSLRDMSQNDREDYLKINEVIARCIPQVIHSFHERNKVVEIVKNNLLKVYKWILIVIIKNWRETAWRNYLELQKNASPLNLKNHAAKMANFLSIPHSSTV